MAGLLGGATCSRSGAQHRCGCGGPGTNFQWTELTFVKADEQHEQTHFFVPVCWPGKCLPCFVFVQVVSRAEPDPIDAKALTIASNISVVNHYRFRGIDQTWGHPALQGGVDANWSNGWYAGLWASNVSGNTYPGGSLELDYYGGFSGRFGDGLSFSVGGYGYAYPGANLAHSACPSAAMAAPCSQVSQRFDTFEVNAGVSWKWVSYKLSISATDYFGRCCR